MKGIKEGFPSQTLVRMPVESVARMKELAFTRSLYATDIGYYPEAKNHYVERTHGSPNFIFIYCVGGKGWCELNGTRWEVNAMQGILIPQDSPHRYGTPDKGSWRIHWLHFNGLEALALFELLHEQADKPIIYLPRPDPIVDAFADTLRWTRHNHTQNCLIALSGACARLLGLVADSRRATANRTREVEERIRQTISRMRESLRTPLRLEDLASEACLSIPHYCALFKKQTSRTPMQLYTDLRIQRACELLHTTRMGVQEIAREVGYDDGFYFSRAFKKTMGLPPSDYRKSFGSPER